LVNRYEVQQQLAKKSGKRILLARDLLTYDLVIVKLLPLSSEFEWDDVKLFEREAQTLKFFFMPSLYTALFRLDLLQN
jgi:serine/threonine protein kinase